MTASQHQNPRILSMNTVRRGVNKVSSFVFDSVTPQSLSTFGCTHNIPVVIKPLPVGDLLMVLTINLILRERTQFSNAGKLPNLNLNRMAFRTVCPSI